jgi:hypothetical protein
MNRNVKDLLSGRTALLILVILVFGASAFAAGPKKKILYNFTDQADGGYPFAGVISDSAGVLYGIASSGGESYCDSGGPCGVMFSLTPPQSGERWTENPLYDFDDWSIPTSPQTGLVFDSKGNLYGSILYSIYQLAPSQGSWTFNIVYTNQGSQPLNDPVVDSAGNVYFDDGWVFESTPGANETWTTNTITSTDAGIASLVMDKQGRLYGTTGGGIPNCGNLKLGCGIVFQLTPQSGGAWQYNVIYEFLGENTGYMAGVAEELGLAIDAEGNLYGSAEVTNKKCPEGGVCELVFELSPPAEEGGAWTEAPLHVFEGGKDGSLLYGSPSVDRLGQVYGTTNTGGSGFCLQNGVELGCGTVYRLTPPAVKGGKWSETLYSFQGGSDGYFPYGNVLIGDKKGVVYGTTPFGGTYNAGTAWEILFP